MTKQIVRETDAALREIAGAGVAPVPGFTGASTGYSTQRQRQ